MRKKKEKKRVEDKYKIISIDGSQLYAVSHCTDGSSKNLVIRDEKGALILDNFKGYMDPSMEMDHLSYVYKNHKQEFGGHPFTEKMDKTNSEIMLTPTLISVSFDKSYKEYNIEWCETGDRYVKAGCIVRDDEIKDHVCVREENGKRYLAAIEIPHLEKRQNKNKVKFDKEMARYSLVENPIPDKELGKYFAYDAKAKTYTRATTKKGAIRQMSAITKVSDIRHYLYVNGFYADGMHYVRYKRSAGKSREGSCLFIAEPLYKDMMEWSAAGLDPDNMESLDLASWEAYTALTLSNKKKTIVIPKASILVVKDYVYEFADTVVAVESSVDPYGKKCIKSKEKEKIIRNNIWDGEALLDSSVFNDEKNDLGGHGMLLLRNRFFKTCAFNTNIQKWFKDNNITKISELNGFTTAHRVEEIKMIVTNSSVKYLKMLGIDEDSDDETFNRGVKQWLENIDKYFGVVKMDEPSRFMDGMVVPTTYQLINTLGLTRDEVSKLLAETVEYKERLKVSPVYMRHYLRYRLEDIKKNDIYTSENEADEEEDEEESGDNDNVSLNYRYTAMLEMLKLCDEFTGTVFYKDEQHNIVEAMRDRVRRGKVYVQGQYATLFGNGPELLKAVIKEMNFRQKPSSELRGDAIYTTLFDFSKELLCSRNPHVTMGNIYLANNTESEFIKKYFNLTRQIVCVNAIGNNIQHRLNGCDYDSDTMLITDNAVLLDAAKRNYDRFLVPVCCLDGSKKKYENTLEDRAELDELIAKNVIGEIINTSQLFNSHLWNVHHNNPNPEIEKGIYQKICELAVLSGVEIDKAKRMYNINMEEYLLGTRLYKKEIYGDSELPKFFLYIQKRPTKNGREPDTAMEYVFEATSDFTSFKGKVDKLDIEQEKKARAVKLEDLVDDYVTEPGNNDYHYKQEIVDLADEAHHRIKLLNLKMKSQSDSEKVYSREQKQEILEKLLIDVSKKLKNDNIVRLLLRHIDKVSEKGYKDTMTKHYKESRNTLFSALCSEGAHRFYAMVTRHRKQPIYMLKNATSADNVTEYIYGIPQERELVEKGDIELGDTSAQ